MLFPGHPFIKAKIFALCSEFFQCAFSRCKNGVLPNVKLTQALQKLHLAAPIYSGKQQLSHWAPDASGNIRMMAHHYRTMVMDANVQGKVMSKAIA